MGVTLNPIGSNGAKIWQDDVYPWKVYGAVGPGIHAWALHAGLPSDDTTNSPTSFIATQGGTSPTTIGIVPGYPLLVTTGGTDYNGSNLQLRGAQFKALANKQAFLSGTIKLNEATTSDFLFGLCELKTDLLKTSASHGINTAVEGAFFFKATTSTSIIAKIYKAGTESVSVAVGTMTAADIKYAIWWDGVTFHFYLNDVEVTKAVGTVPTAALTPSLNVRTGAASAVTASIAELGYVAVD